MKTCDGYFKNIDVGQHKMKTQIATVVTGV